LIAEDDGGTIWTSADFVLGNGANRVWAQAINGQAIFKLTVEASGALINDIRQVRLTQSTLAIPEPSSMAVAGFACLAGIGLVIRRRKKLV
jgi:LPXTG-motif cell wall-anchored protein